MGFWQNIRQSSDALFQLRQSLVSGSQSINSSPLKRYLLDLLKDLTPEPIQVGPLDLREVLPVMLSELTDAQILEMARLTHGKLGEFLNTWTGDNSQSEEKSMPSSPEQPAVESQSSLNGSSTIQTSDTPSSMTRNTPAQSESGAVKPLSIHGKSLRKAKSDGSFIDLRGKRI